MGNKSSVTQSIFGKIKKKGGGLASAPDDLRTIPNYARVLRPVEILLRLTNTLPSVELTKLTQIARADFHSALCWFVFFRYSTLFTCKVPSLASETIRRYVLGLIIRLLDRTIFIYIHNYLPPFFS